MNTNILRKIDANESYFINSNDLTHVCRLFRITSEIDYYQHLDLLKQAINKWTQLHPLLLANFEKLNEIIYFVKNHDESSLQNVKFYQIDSNSFNKNNPDEQYNEIVHLLIENETQTMLETSYRLWRLIFINQTVKTDFNYDVIFTIHHTITEGRNVCYIFQQLLDLFEQLYDKKSINSLTPHSVLPSMEDLILKKQNENNENAEAVKSIKKPSFINSSKAINDSHEETLRKYTKYSNVIINSLDDDKSLNIDDLIQTAKLNQTKFKFVSFSESDSLKLVRKLKEKRVKMQPFLNVLFSMAFKNVYRKLGDSSEYNHSTVYGHLVSLRQFSTDLELFGQSLNDNMGFYATSFWYTNSDEITFDNFWQNCLNENVKLVNKLNTGEQFKNPNYLNFNPDELFADFELSNLGVISQSFKDSSKHVINSCFISVQSESPIRLCFNNFITINNRLYWSFIYNSYLIHKDLLDEIYLTILEIFQILVN